jgi:hypothetical protein
MKIVGGLKRKERVYLKKLVRTTILDGEHRGHGERDGLLLFCSSPLTSDTFLADVLGVPPVCA